MGNPTADEVKEYRESGDRSLETGFRSQKPVIALLAGSRKQEIKDNLLAMLEAVKEYEKEYRIVVAGAPSIESAYYEVFLQGNQAEIVYDQTYPLLASAYAALVTSGTATLEACLFQVPQVVCYEFPLHWLSGFLRKHLIKVRYVSLVNLIANREVVTELVADTFSVENIRKELNRILKSPARETMLQGYNEVRRRLGDQKAPDNAARMILQLLESNRHT